MRKPFKAIQVALKWVGEASIGKYSCRFGQYSIPLANAANLINLGYVLPSAQLLLFASNFLHGGLMVGESIYYNSKYFIQRKLKSRTSKFSKFHMAKGAAGLILLANAAYNQHHWTRESFEPIIKVIQGTQKILHR
jgi:hypothetical protein